MFFDHKQSGLKTKVHKGFTLLAGFLLLAVLNSSAQVDVAPDYIGYGQVGPLTDRVTDILIRNDGNKKIYILRTDIPAEFDFRFSTKSIEPDSTAVLRVKFRPTVTGVFEEKIAIYLSSQDEPEIIPVDALVTFIDPNDHLPCPDFSQRAADCCPSNMFLAEVIDSLTRKPLQGATVTISEQGTTQLKLRTGSEGTVSQFVPIGFYTLEARMKGYSSTRIVSYVNKQHHFFRFELVKDDREQEEIVEEIVVEDTVVVIPEEIIPEVIAESELLPESVYSANNIVFLVDVSQSMAASDKMDLMKISLVELAGALRSIDKMGLVSYASDANLLLPSVPGDRKEEITSIVNTLDAGGSTSGAKGFKTAFDQLRKNYIEGANNQLIVITDGAFDVENQEAIKKLVEKYSKKNIRTSIVGIKPTEYATRNLSEYVSTGQGSFLTITNETDSRNALLEEIRRMSRK